MPRVASSQALSSLGKEPKCKRLLQGIEEKGPDKTGNYEAEEAGKPRMLLKLEQGKKKCERKRRAARLSSSELSQLPI
jgi:hypothetical protein